SSYDLAPVTPPAKPERPPARPAPASAAASLPVPAARLQAAEIQIEHNCPHCGFRIVGKPRNNRCPDCNAALDELTTGLLQFAPTGWTRKISTGALIVAAGIL